MKTTYEVIASNSTSFDVTFHDLGACRAKAVADMLDDAFRDIRIICEQTGEVMHNHYTSVDWYRPHTTEECAVATVKKYLAGL